MLPIILLFLARFSFSSAFQAFDCYDPATAGVTYSLMEPGPCPDVEPNYEPPKPIHIQVIQEMSQDEIPFYRCRASVTRIVTRCGITSLTYGSHYVNFLTALEIVPKTCRDAVKSGKLTILDRSLDFVMNVPSSYSFYSHGSVDKDGGCENEAFVRNGVRYERSYEETIVSFEVNEAKGRVDLTSGNILLLDNIQVPLGDLATTDALAGTMFWDKNYPSCSRSISEVYVGPAILHQKLQGKIEDSLILINSSSTGQMAGLALKKSTSLCGSHSYKTHIPDISVIILRDFDTPVQTEGLSYKSYTERADLLGQSAFLHFSLALTLGSNFRMISTAICELERKTLFNKIQDISGNRNSHAIRDLFGVGHTLVVAGAVVHIKKCKSVDVNFRQIQNCSEEIPVYYQNSSAFVDPVTLNIKSTGNIVTCDPIQPVKWFIFGRWYCNTPQLISCQSPLMFEPSKPLNLTAYDPEGGLSGSLYSTEQRAQHKRYLESKDARDPIVSQLVEASLDNSLGPSILGSPLSTLDMDHIYNTLGEHIFPLFSIIGNAFYYLQATLFIIAVVVSLVSSAIRSFYAYRKFGCGGRCFMSIWTSIVFMVSVPVDMVKDSVGRIKHAISQIDNLDDHQPPSAPPLHEKRVFLRLRKNEKPSSMHISDYTVTDAGELLPIRKNDLV